MRLNYLKFKNNKILGNLELDFRSNGTSASTIFIAGENGTGKTTILNAIYNLSKLRRESFDKTEGTSYGVSLTTQQLAFIEENVTDPLLEEGQLSPDIEIAIAPQDNKDWPSNVTVTGSVNGKEIKIPKAYILGSEFRTLTRLLYSNVEINFNPKNITNVTSKNIDETLTSQTTSAETATEITQLLIDIETLDNSDLAKWAKENAGKPVPENIVGKRIGRFQSAFSRMFPTKRYDGIENINNRKKVVFIDNGKKCFIENLSSGEKQIVFRGGFS
ncbi:sigma 54-interacting transcriptional regulator [Microbulbifer sp. VAAF005]|uniref:sigma 54-interacting transcriptional regulator n=1 Tax=Microbulbifer sp. VAAF005 TaxID=3034230 RepID=UPI0024AE78D9|nr:sigma 54-interacting transcriptional regulator [Microbulbifer sp. VAAF005]WHI46611.1 sigma 54-interacting transcriptional regulator [Microbulbifer sp. VAAF005]